MHAYDLSLIAMVYCAGHLRVRRQYRYADATAGFGHDFREGQGGHETSTLGMTVSQEAWRDKKIGVF